MGFFGIADIRILPIMQTVKDRTKYLMPCAVMLLVGGEVEWAIDVALVVPSNVMVAKKESIFDWFFW